MRATQKLKGQGAVHAGKTDRMKSVIQSASGFCVPQSGIYEVTHPGEDRPAHEVVLLSGKLFPRCEGCGEVLGFRLLRAVPYIFQDGDFARESRVPKLSSLAAPSLH